MERIRREGQNFFEVVAPQEEEDRVFILKIVFMNKPSVGRAPNTNLVCRISIRDTF
jgi:hypothetical protein